jgi:hypothetical protein
MQFIRYLILLYSWFVFPSSSHAEDRLVEYFISSGSEGSLNFSQNSEAKQLIQIESDGKIISTYAGVISEISSSRDSDLLLNGVLLKVYDFNFDGFADLAISSSVGFGLINVYYDIFIFLPGKNKFSDRVADICNPIISNHKKQIIVSNCSQINQKEIRIIGTKVEVIN